MNPSKTIRPSSMPMLGACPRWHNAPEDVIRDDLNEAAEEGTLVHAAMEQIISSGTPPQEVPQMILDMEELTPALQQLVQACYDQLQDVLFWNPVAIAGTVEDPDHPSGKRILELSHVYQLYKERTSGDLFQEAHEVDTFMVTEVGVDSGIVRPGTADLVVVHGALATLIDYKTNRVERDHTLQQAAYVLGVFEALPGVQTVVSRIISPRLSEDVHPDVVYSREDVPNLRKELEEILEKVKDPFSPGRPGAHCAFCWGNGRCPWQASALQEVIPQEYAIQQADRWVKILHPKSPMDRSLRRALVRWLTGFADAIKEDDKEWALANPEGDLPGWRRTTRAGRKRINKERLAEVNNALCSTFAVSPDKLLSFVALDRNLFVEYIRMANGMTKKDAEKELNKALAPFMEEGPPITVFTATKDLLLS